MSNTPTIRSPRFYDERHLETPFDERWPTDRRQLVDLIDELEAADKPYRVVGAGHHLRCLNSPAETTVIRTTEVNAVLDIDRQSGLVHVEAGITWRALQDALDQTNLTLRPYRLHPAHATLGGLLARHRPGPSYLRGGSIIDGCVSMGAHRTDTGNYRYLVAPRKAAGPDLRHLFIGRGDRHGAITDLRLIAWRPTEARLLVYEDCAPDRAQLIMDTWHRADLEGPPLHFGLKSRRLQLFLSAPGQLLRQRIKWLSNAIGAPDSIDDASGADTRRQWLESRHPDRRHHPDAPSTQHVWWTPEAFRELSNHLHHRAVDVQVLGWTPHRVHSFVTYDRPLDQIDDLEPPDDATDRWAQAPLLRTA